MRHILAALTRLLLILMASLPALAACAPGWSASAPAGSPPPSPSAAPAGGSGGSGGMAAVAPPQSLAELLDRASLIFIGEVGPVVRYLDFVMYGDDGQLVTERPVTGEGWTVGDVPATDFLLNVETVIRDDGAFASGKPILLRVAGAISQELKQLTREGGYEEVTYTGDRYLFLLVPQPDGQTYGFYYGWSRLIVDGDSLRLSDGTGQPLHFADEPPITLTQLKEAAAARPAPTGFPAFVAPALGVVVDADQRVVEVAPMSAAAAAGLQAGDVLLDLAWIPPETPIAAPAPPEAIVNPDSPLAVFSLTPTPPPAAAYIDQSLAPFTDQHRINFLTGFGEPLKLRLLRGGQVLEVTMTPTIILSPPLVPGGISPTSTPLPPAYHDY